jgi:hypothetical protein
LLLSRKKKLDQGGGTLAARGGERKTRRKKKHSMSKVSTEPLGALSDMQATSDHQKYLSQTPPYSPFDRSYPTCSKYGYANVAVDPEMKGENPEFNLSSLPFDQAGKFWLEVTFPQIAHVNTIKKKKVESSSSSSTTSSSTSSSSESTSGLGKDHVFWRQDHGHLAVVEAILLAGEIPLNSSTTKSLHALDAIGPSDKGSDEEIGHFDSEEELADESSQCRTRLINLFLGFGESHNSMLPLFSTRDTPLKIRIIKNKLENLFQSSDGKVPYLVKERRQVLLSDIKFRLLVDVYVMNNTELTNRFSAPSLQYIYFKNSSFEWVVKGSQPEDGYAIPLPFHGPVSQLLFTVQHKDHRDAKETTNCWYRNGDSIQEAKLSLGNNLIVDWRSPIFWRRATMERFPKKPKIPLYGLSRTFFPQLAERPAGDWDLKDHTLVLHVRLPRDMEGGVVNVNVRSFATFTVSKNPKGSQRSHTISTSSNEQ